MDIHIRTEIPNDFPDIDNLLQQVFAQPNEARLVDNMRKTEDYIPELALVAELFEQIVGHIVFSHIHIESQDQKIPALALVPMAVLPDFQSKEIGSALVHKGLTLSREAGYKIVIVLGHEKYYPRFGFLPASKYNIKPPFDVLNEVFMALSLEPDAPENIEGVVRYPDVFLSV